MSPGSEISIIMHLGINVSSSTHKSRCRVNGGNAMAAIRVLFLYLKIICYRYMYKKLYK